jgi:hypothetical protein
MAHEAAHETERDIRHRQVALSEDDLDLVVLGDGDPDDTEPAHRSGK